MAFINSVEGIDVRSRVSLSLRAKIVLLILSALTVSLCSYLYVGTTLIIGDKTSYIYDYNLSQSRLAAKSVEVWLSKAGPQGLTETSKPDAALLKEDSSKDTSLFLYDVAGRRWLQSGEASYLQNGGDLEAGSMQGIVKDLLASTFPSGAREWSSSKGREFILSYQRVSDSKLTVIAAVPKSAAFAAANALVQRSVALGISLLLASIGFAMLFVSGLTKRIRELWFATRRVAEGDFSVRVDTRRKSSDEIGSLGESFNMMADKIDELMVHTAEKARMEKELETAQVVQNRFFPPHPFQNEICTISGRVVPASECGGDWWFYAPLGDCVLVVIGDVTGHGVSSALVTAAVHGGFAMLVRKYQQAKERPNMKDVIEHLNGVVCAAARQEVTMTFVASLLDLSTGQMEFVNASHRPPYVYRGGKAKPLVEAKCAALGQELSIQVDSVAKVQLEPGDVIFWYTDGVLECTNPQGKTINRNTLAKMVQALKDKHPSDAPAICEEFLKQTMDFFGSNASNLADDVSVVFSVIDQRASFVKKQRAA